MTEYRVKPDFERPEPSAAKFHSHRDLPDDPRDAQALFIEMARSQHEHGARFFRYTIVSPKHPHPPYPHGLYVEGWENPHPVPIPFGDAEKPGGAIWPPLTERPA